MILERPPPFCSSKSHKCENVPYYSHEASLKAVLTCFSQAALTLLLLPEYTSKDISKCNFSTILNCKRRYYKKRSLGFAWTITNNKVRLIMTQPLNPHIYYYFKYKYFHSSVDWLEHYL